MTRALQDKLRGMTVGERRDFEMVLVWRCPSYPVCSAPRCPLDPLYHDREHVGFPDDEKCRAQKSTRLRLVGEARAQGIETVAYLPYDGLKAAEAAGRAGGEAGRARWEAMTEEERAQRLERMAVARKAR